MLFKLRLQHHSFVWSLSYYCFVDVLEESIGVLTQGTNGLLSCILSKWAAITCYILSCNFMILR